LSVRLGGARNKLRGCQAVILMTVALVVATGANPATTDAHTPGTTPEFFGVNGAFLRDYVQPAKATTLEGLAASMEAEGIDWARLTFDQAVDERTRGNFNWYAPDAMVTALARHGVRGAGSFIGTAYWAADPALNGAYGARAWPYDIEGWSEWVAAAARRFGTNGTFWAQHPELPYLPIKRWEIGNEVNSGIFWRPAANPEQYAAVYSASQAAITGVDPQAEVMVAGLAPRFGWKTAIDLDVPAFLTRMIAADPSLRERIPSVAIHPYAETPEEALDMVARFRQAMRAAGMPDTPMIANEIGWYTQGADGPLKATEAERAAKISTVANQLWRTDCGVEGLAPYSWITSEIDPENSEHWYGLASSVTGEPNAGGLANGEQIRVARGLATGAPPEDTVQACGPKTLTVQKTGAGTVTSSPGGIDCGQSCSTSFDDGATLNLTPTPALGYAFRGWSGCDSVSGNRCTVAVYADRSVTAKFVPQRTLSVQASGSGKAISYPVGIDCGQSCIATVDDGATVILYPGAAPGYAFRGWSGCDSVGSSNQCTVVMNGDRTVSAQFSEPRTLSVQKSGSGSVSSSPAGIACGPSCGATVPEGTQFTLTPSAAPGYAFRGWSGCDSVAGDRCTITVNTDRTVSANFVARRTLNVQKTGPGTVASVPAGIDCGSSCSTVVDDGTGLRLAATPARGYRFAGWSGCPAPSGSECELTLRANVTVTATFEPIAPPETWISKTKVNPRSSTATFTFGGGEGTGALHYSCRLDSRPLRPCGNAASYRLTRGRHTFQVVAEDELGRADPTPATRTFRVKRRPRR
jgi:hypothetical protein